MLGSPLATSEGAIEVTKVRYKYNKAEYIINGKTGGIDVRHFEGLATLG